MLQALIGPVTGLLDKFIEDKDQKAKLAHEIATMAEKQAHEAALAQVAVNQQEAKHKSLFVAGWRPSVGWICSIALGYHFVFQPLILFGAGMAGVTLPDLPEFDMDSLMTVLLGMLGLGGLRTYEKQKGLTK
jgi:phenylpyruvate tautomerase PptA (4-oxalocrotonate tautomerase family)